MHEWEYNVEEKPRRIVNKLGEVSFDKPEPVNNLITWVYETGSFVPCAKIVGNETFSIINDYIGRPILAFNEKGEKVWETDYDIYGNLRNLKGEKDFIPFRQLGQYEDIETGMYYNRFRYYDYNTGTYISKDPISILGGLNVYAYVFDSNKFVDVFGLADFIVTPQGTVVSTKKDINLVSTSDDGNWFQIHFEHEHDGLKPHTHYPEKNNSNTNRRYKKTDAVDLDYADKMLKEGKLRHRRNRKDKGGCI